MSRSAGRSRSGFRALKVPPALAAFKGKRPAGPVARVDATEPSQAAGDGAARCEPPGAIASRSAARELSSSRSVHEPSSSTNAYALISVAGTKHGNGVFVGARRRLSDRDSEVGHDRSVRPERSRVHVRRSDGIEVLELEAEHFVLGFSSSSAAAVEVGGRPRLRRGAASGLASMPSLW